MAATGPPVEASAQRVLLLLLRCFGGLLEGRRRLEVSQQLEPHIRGFFERRLKTAGGHTVLDAMWATLYYSL
jgi:hypothetical protein